jgi:hypothetical protein
VEVLANALTPEFLLGSGEPQQDLEGGREYIWCAFTSPLHGRGVSVYPDCSFLTSSPPLTSSAQALSPGSGAA